MSQQRYQPTLCKRNLYLHYYARLGILLKTLSCSLIDASYIFAEFPSWVAENSAHAGSVILDCILSLDSGFIDDNSALHVPFCNLSTPLHSNPRITKMLHLLGKEIQTQIRNSVWDSRLTHVLQWFVGTDILLNKALLDNHAARFLCT